MSKTRLKKRDPHRFNRAQEPLLSKVLKTATEHATALQGQGLSRGESVAVSATALLSAAVTLMVASGVDKEVAILGIQTALAAPTAAWPPPPAPPEGEPN